MHQGELHLAATEYPRLTPTFVLQRVATDPAHIFFSEDRFRAEKVPRIPYDCTTYFVGPDA